jgi:hypothetical protein
VTKFQSTLIAIAFLAGTGCYATVRGQDGYSSRHGEAGYDGGPRSRGEAYEHQRGGHPEGHRGDDRDRD